MSNSTIATHNHQIDPRSHPLVSIIIPCYNAEKYVAESIQSALDQTYPNCEVIVIDDGSTDGSLKVIKGFGDKIRWETGPNKGGCAARNRGLTLSKGTFIKFLDSDDLLTRECIYNEIIHTLESAEDLIICSSLSVVPGTPLSELSSKWLYQNYDIETLIFDGTPQTSTPLHRKKNLLKIGGFTDGLPCCQEYDLHLRLAIILGMQYRILPNIGSLIRPRENSLSRRPEAPIVETRAAILMKIANEYKEHSSCSEIDACKIIELIAQALTLLARTLWRCGNKEKSIYSVNYARRLSSNWYQKAYKSRIISIIPVMFGFVFYERIHSALIKVLPCKKD